MIALAELRRVSVDTGGATDEDASQLVWSDVGYAEVADMEGDVVTDVAMHVVRESGHDDELIYLGRPGVDHNSGSDVPPIMILLTLGGCSETPRCPSSDLEILEAGEWEVYLGPDVLVETRVVSVDEDNIVFQYTEDGLVRTVNYRFSHRD